MKIKEIIYGASLVLLIIGGLNWGLVGLFNLDLVAKIFGILTPLSRLIYVIVGVSAILVASFLLMKKAKLP